MEFDIMDSGFAGLTAGLAIVGFLGLLWYVITIVQLFFAYGTAYRLTRNGGDNGVALWGWFFVMSLASMIPGLGIYLWIRYKNI